MATRQVTFSYVDASGNFIQSSFLSDTDGLGINIFMKDLSNAGVLYDVVGERDLTYASEGANALYPSARQLAVLTFEDAVGGQCSLTIPAPIASIFEADGVTVDPTNVQVALLILNAITGGALLTAAGNPVVAYLSGTRIGRGA